MKKKDEELEEPSFTIRMSEADSNWLQAKRLLDRAKRGDKEAAKELKEMEKRYPEEIEEDDVIIRFEYE